MKEIRLTQEAYVCGECGGYNWYEAMAADREGNEYLVKWEIEDYAAFENGDEEECCDWDNPVEVYSFEEHKTVEAKILW